MNSGYPAGVRDDFDRGPNPEPTICPHCNGKMFTDDGDYFQCFNGCRTCEAIDCQEQAVAGSDDCAKHKAETDADELEQFLAQHGIVMRQDGYR